MPSAFQADWSDSFLPHFRRKRGGGEGGKGGGAPDIQIGSTIDQALLHRINEGGGGGGQRQAVHSSAHETK